MASRPGGPGPGGPGGRRGPGPGPGGGFFGRPAPPPPPRHPGPPPGGGGFFGRPAPPPPRHSGPPPRPPRHGSLAGDILIGGMLAGLGELLEESMDTSTTDDSPSTVLPSQSVKLPSECPFCGAPVVSSVCEYCGRNVAQNG